jgi:hypothetical protein
MEILQIPARVKEILSENKFLFRTSTTILTSFSNQDSQKSECN